MPIIGTFSAVKDGYAGTVRTMTLNAKVGIVANDHKGGDGLSGKCSHCGAGDSETFTLHHGNECKGNRKN